MCVAKIIFHILCLPLILWQFSCATYTRNHSSVPLNLAKSPDDILRYLENRDLAIDDLKLMGPFHFKEISDIAINLPKNAGMIDTDFYLPTITSPSQTILLVHGNGGNKNDFERTAKHLASWGLASISINLPPTNRWLENALTLRRLVNSLRRTPPSFCIERCNLQNLSIVGFSFGATASSLAVADGLEVDKLILLDPALFTESETDKLSRIALPTVIIGADTQIFQSKGREYFYQKIPSSLEVTLHGTSHQDAQGRTALLDGVYWDFDSESRRNFRAAITATLLVKPSPNYLEQLSSLLDQWFLNSHKGDFKIKF